MLSGSPILLSVCRRWRSCRGLETTVTRNIPGCDSVGFVTRLAPPCTPNLWIWKPASTSQAPEEALFTPSVPCLLPGWGHCPCCLFSRGTRVSRILRTSIRLCFYQTKRTRKAIKRYWRSWSVEKPFFLSANRGLALAKQCHLCFKFFWTLL